VKRKMKKTFVLVVLFVFPLVAYLFFASGVNNFGRLPVLTKNIGGLKDMDPAVSFEGHITILGFLGSETGSKKGNVFNLNQKIYKPFYEFNEFQMVMVVPDGIQKSIAELRKELGSFTDTSKWKFVYGSEAEIRALFDSLQTNLHLDSNLATPFVFIVDKEGNLRGRKDDDGEGVKFGFNAISVAELNNKMEDDVKVILAEYRLELKKNNAKRDK
jgi:hypothetical protein